LSGLWLLPLLAALYAVRRRAARVDVPFLPFWEKVLAGRRRRASLARTFASVLLQAAMFALALAAVAGPYRTDRRAADVPLTLIVDRTAATAAPETSAAVMRRAREIAHAQVASGPASLGAWVDGRVVPLGRAAARDEVDALLAKAPAPSGVRDPEAVRAVGAAASPPGRVLVVTPFAVGDPASALEIVAVAGAPPKNGGLRAVERTATGLAVRVENGEGRALRLYDGAVALASTPAADRTELPLPASRPAAPRLALEPPDPWPDDDAVDLDFGGATRLKVVLASAAPTPALDAALAATDLVDAARSGRAGPSEWRRVADRYDVIVLVGLDLDLPPPPGRYLLFDATAPELPWARGAGSGEARALRRRDDVAWLAALDPDEWTVHRASTFLVGDGAEVLAESDRGPLIARLRRGAVRAIAIAPPPTVAASTLPLLPAFPLMVRGALRELAPAEDAARPLADPRRLRSPTPEGLAPAVDAPPRPSEDVEERRSERPFVLLVLAALLMTEWALYQFGATD
ncbi:MAG TPA: hypothetical protein VEI02_00915, partial [Planctomycetota bacterium]|nr:hypothetical protein [Planctomycetota bacterium]